jgi:hypothetical protein
VSTTVTFSGPAMVTSAAGMAAVIRFAFTKEVVCAAPFQSTVELVVKFEPTTLNVNADPPCVLLLGEIAETAGGGPGITGGVDPLPHAVSALKDPRNATCRGNFIEPLRRQAGLRLPRYGKDWQLPTPAGLAKMLLKLCSQMECISIEVLLLTGQHDRNPVTTKHEKTFHANPCLQ